MNETADDVLSAARPSRDMKQALTMSFPLVGSEHMSIATFVWHIESATPEKATLGLVKRGSSRLQALQSFVSTSNRVRGPNAAVPGLQRYRPGLW